MHKFNLFHTFLFFAITGYLNGFVAVNMYDPEKYYSPLVDYFHIYLPQIAFGIPNYLLLSYIVYFLARKIRLNNLCDLNNFMISVSLLFTIRLFTFPLTIVPPPFPNCQSRNASQGIIWNVFGSLYDGSDNTCIDMMFSGHASYFTLIFLYMFANLTNRYEKILNIAFWAMGVFSVILSHMHYTSDVIVGIALSKLMYDKMFAEKPYFD